MSPIAVIILILAFLLIFGGLGSGYYGGGFNTYHWGGGGLGLILLILVLVLLFR